MLLSIVVPCYNEQEALPYFYKEICRVAEEMKSSHGADFEFIFVDDGSKDKTLSITRETNEERGRKLMQFSYSMRMLVMALWLILAVSMPFLHWVAAALPLLFPRLTIAVMQLTGVYKKEQDNEEKGEQVDHER